MQRNELVQEIEQTTHEIQECNSRNKYATVLVLKYVCMCLLYCKFEIFIIFKEIGVRFTIY